jgi:glyoxylase-like metal-dependent hydrolase (beta-lactamase superfamily II)
VTVVGLGGDVTVTAILDAIADHPSPLLDAFAGMPASAVDEFPATVGRDGRWRLPVYVYLIQAFGRAVLVDTGVGPAGTAASAWLGVTGTLDVPAPDLVVFTHLHSDHVGRRFEGVRHVVSESEPVPPGVELALETAAPGELVAGVELVALPGHTPGHSGVRITGPAGEVLLLGDTFNHPAQIAAPAIASGADADRLQATRTREEVLERRGPGIRFASAHFPDGWWGE